MDSTMITNRGIGVPTQMNLDLPTVRVLTGEIFKPDVVSTGPLCISIDVSWKPFVVIDADYFVWPKPEAPSVLE